MKTTTGHPSLDPARLKQLCDAAVEIGAGSTSRRLQYHLRFTFRHVDVADRVVLDVGGGSGLHSVYAALAGAKRVVCLEPGAAGGNDRFSQSFQRLAESCGVDRDMVCQIPTTLQDFVAPASTFDAIILHNSVNHLDENACIALQRDSICREAYRRLFRKLGNLAADGASLIVCDCSRHSFWSMLGLASPFAPTIEWDKHQAPQVWAKMLESQGFNTRHLRWSTPNAWGDIGQFVLGFKSAAYFLSSHFCLTMRHQSIAADGHSRPSLHVIQGKAVCSERNST